MPTGEASSADRALAATCGATLRQIEGWRRAGLIEKPKWRRADLIEEFRDKPGRGYKGADSELAHEQAKIVAELTNKNYSFVEIAGILFVMRKSHKDCTRVYQNSCKPPSLLTKDPGNSEVLRHLRKMNLLIVNTRIAPVIRRTVKGWALDNDDLGDDLEDYLNEDILGEVVEQFSGNPDHSKYHIPDKVAEVVYGLIPSLLGEWNFSVEELEWARNLAWTILNQADDSENPEYYKTIVSVLSILVAGDVYRLRLLTARRLIPFLIVMKRSRFRYMLN